MDVIPIFCPIAAFGAHTTMLKVPASIRLVNARKRIDYMLAKARRRVDKILVNRSASATDAHADRLHRLVDVVEAQALSEPMLDAATNVAPGLDPRLTEATDQSVAASQPETVKTPLGPPLVQAPKKYEAPQG